MLPSSWGMSMGIWSSAMPLNRASITAVRSLVSTAAAELLSEEAEEEAEEEAAPEEAVLEELPAVEPQAARARARVRAVRVIASFFIKITPFSFANTAQFTPNCSGGVSHQNFP